MTFGAIGLLFVSAILHTTWNLLVKRTEEKYITVWWGMLLGSTLFLPFLLFTGLPASSTWLLLLISVLFEIAYYIALTSAYNYSDFSLVYPIGRGAAPAFIALWSVLFLSERLTRGGIIGIIIIIIGLMIVGGTSLFQSHTKPPLRGLFLAILLGLFISIYSTIDGAVVKKTPTFPYAILIFFLAPTLMTPHVLKLYGWTKLKVQFAVYHWRMLLVGLLTVASYFLALVAYSVSRMGYAGAIREVSVVMAAFAGWKFLGEKLGGTRVIGAVVIFGGILVIAFFG
jgi:drug/metabolite transporter (DMT)-like permease